MNIRTMREKRAKLITDAQALIPKQPHLLTPEIERRFNALLKDADAIKKNYDTIERAGFIAAELRDVKIKTPSLVTEPEIHYHATFEKYLRKGTLSLTTSESNLLGDRRAQSYTTGSGGGYLIPQGFQKELEVALKFFGGVRQVARQITTATGNLLPWPNTNDTTNMGARLSTLSGTATEQDVTFGSVTFNAYTYTSKAITVPNELLADSAFDLFAFIRERFVERIGRIQNNEFTLYNSAGGPQGIVPFATSRTAGGITTATGNTTTLTYNNLVDLEHSLDKSYRDRAKWMMNDSTFQAIRKIVDGFGRPLLSPGIDGADPDTILGHPYEINQDMAVPAANAVTVLFGDFQKYIVRDIEGISVLRLDQINALSNATTFVAFARSDARGVDAGTGPCSFIQQAAS